MANMSIEEYRKLLDKTRPSSKYNNKRTPADGFIFASQKEANFYCELKMRLRVKDIKGFCIQPRFVLAEGLEYRADFVIWENDGTSRIVDTKGFKTDVYKNKKKIFEDKFNLIIEEI